MDAKNTSGENICGKMDSMTKNQKRRRNSSAEVIKFNEDKADSYKTTIKLMSEARKRRLQRLNSEPLSQTKLSGQQDRQEERQGKANSSLAQTCPSVYVSLCEEKQSKNTPRKRNPPDLSENGKNATQSRQSDPSARLLLGTDIVSPRARETFENGSDSLTETDVSEKKDTLDERCDDDNCSQSLCNGYQHDKNSSTITPIDNVFGTGPNEDCNLNRDIRSEGRGRLHSSVHTTGKSLRGLLKQLTCIRKEISSEHECLESEKYAAVSGICQLRDTLVQHIDGFINSITDDANNKFQEALNTKSKEQKLVDSFILEVTNLCQNIGNPKNTRGKSQGQISELVKTAEERCQKINMDIMELREKICKINIRFLPDLKLCKPNSLLQSLEVKVVEEKCFSNYTHEKEIVDSEFSSWVSGDLMETTCITGVACLQDGALVVADSFNQSLKVFDSNFVHQSSINLTTSPWSLAVNGENKILVTLPDFKQICQFSVEDNKLTKELTIEAGGECLGVVDAETEIIISCYDGDIAELIAVNKQGGFSRKSIHHAKDEKCLLKRPNYLQKNNECTVLYVSDADMGLYGISIADLETVVFLHRSAKLLCPLGIGVDNRGHIFVCGGQSHNIHELTPNGELCRIVTTKKQTPSPQYVCVHDYNRTLLASLDSEYGIKVFQLS